MIRSLLLGLLLMGSQACTTGEGEGSVQSDRLVVTGCWSGPFDLRPTFFSAQPTDSGDSLMVRVQRGDDIQEFSDGLVLVVYDLPKARAALGQPLEAGLPHGVAPIGVPPAMGPTPVVSLSLFLHASCRGSNGSLHSIGGTVTFDSLFSGDLGETSSAERFTQASFEVSMADPRELANQPERAAELTSTVRGYFQFFFQRGQPAQPFP